MQHSIDIANQQLNNELGENEIASELIADHNAVLDMTMKFVEENHDKISSLVESNKLNSVREMIREDLIENIDAHFTTKEMSDEAKSHPLRRMDGFRQDIIDTVDVCFGCNLEGSDDLLKGISEIFDKDMAEPNYSHSESIKDSPRMERSNEISKETEMEMTAESPQLGMTE